MSVSFDYFFNSEHDLHELAEQINEWLGCRLEVSITRSGSEQAWCRFFGLSLDLYAHTLENDGLFEFENLKYQISLVGPSDVMDMALPLTAMIAYLLYLRLDVKDGALMFDIQTTLARYEERVFEDFRNLFDKISCKLIEHPQHFVDIESRVSL